MLTGTGNYQKIGKGMAIRESTYTNFQCEDKTLVATVEPSGLQGPAGSSILWSNAWAKVLQ